MNDFSELLVGIIAIIATGCGFATVNAVIDEWTITPEECALMCSDRNAKTCNLYTCECF